MVESVISNTRRISHAQSKGNQMNIGQERAEFEVWRRKHYDYEDLTAFEIKFAFAAFQAGRAVLQGESETYVEALEEALSDLIAACPINLNCCDFHHVKADQHDHDERSEERRVGKGDRRR